MVMSAERWEQIDNLLQSALRRPPGQREAFLKEALNGDESLRREVESLLHAHEQAGEFLEATALEVEARAIADSQGQPAMDGTLGPYRILSPLGVGGMGEVYRARDARLGREVAVKVLPAQFIHDQDRLRRFIREAQAASALNHPNIITIYEIGHSNGAHFIATEFIDGHTLRQRITPTGLSLSAALDVALQVASALSAAHAAGIVHRDIKPENVMVRPDGLVKVLDFGLAKLTERNARAADCEAPNERVADSEAPMALKTTTDPGTVMGTAQYMSPEQARGLEVDARTDIFSLGVTLYEMIAGRASFEGATRTEVLVAILEREPAPLSPYAPAIPAELERIITKALVKDREERYQTVEDLLIDLKRLKQRLEYEQYRGEARAARTTSGAGLTLSGIKRHERGALLTLGALVMVIAGVIFGLNKLISQKQSRPVVSFQAAKLTLITTHGRAVGAAISPDGKYIAYAMEEDGKQSLWLRQTHIPASAPIGTLTAAQYSDITFSRDGAFLYYCVRDETDPALSGLYQMTLPDHNPKRLIAGPVLNIALSPDGARLAFVRRDSQTNAPLTLALANTDGSNEQVLATRKLPDVFGPLAWAPDGEEIACVSARFNANLGTATLVAISVKGRAEKQLSDHQWSGVTSVAWLPDGSGMIVSALDRAVTANSQLWQISYPGGAVRKITNDLNDYLGSSLAADSDALVTLQESVSLNLWITSKGKYARATQITARTGKDDGQRGVAWTPDGRLVYTSTASGSPTLWMMNSDGSNQKQLTMTAGQNIRPTVSPDGLYLAFTFLHPGRRMNREVWRINLDGSDPKQIAEDGGFPQCSPDGNWVVYELGPGGMWKAPSAGGAPVQLTEKPSFYLAISPDGKLVASFSRLAQRQITLIPFEGGSPIRLLDLPPTPGSYVPGLRWAPDGRALSYGITHSGVSNIWSLPLDGGPPKQMTDFKAEQIYSFDWSRDGRLVVSRGVASRDVVLISGFR